MERKGGRRERGEYFRPDCMLGFYMEGKTGFLPWLSEVPTSDAYLIKWVELVQIWALGACPFHKYASVHVQTSTQTENRHSWSDSPEILRSIYAKEA